MSTSVETAAASEPILKELKALLLDGFQVRELGSLKFEVSFIDKDEEYWYFTVTPDEQPRHTFPYFESMAETEAEMLLKHDTKVVLIPVIPND